MPILPLCWFEEVTSIHFLNVKVTYKKIRTFCCNESHSGLMFLFLVWLLSNKQFFQPIQYIYEITHFYKNNLIKQHTKLYLGSIICIKNLYQEFLLLCLTLFCQRFQSLLTLVFDKIEYNQRNISKTAFL